MSPGEAPRYMKSRKGSQEESERVRIEGNALNKIGTNGVKQLIQEKKKEGRKV